MMVIVEVLSILSIIDGSFVIRNLIYSIRILTISYFSQNLDSLIIKQISQPMRLTYLLCRPNTPNLEPVIHRRAGSIAILH